MKARDPLQFTLRALLYVIAFVYLIVGMTFLWGLYPIWFASYFFGSALIALSVALFWITSLRTYRALIGIGIASVISFGGIGIHLLQQGIHYGEYCLYAALLSMWLFFLGLKWSAKKVDHLPFSVQALFGILLTFILVIALYLVIPIQSYFLSVLQPGVSVIYGWILIGFALFLGWGLLAPIWEVGYPLLYAILIFDILIVGPFANLFFQESFTKVMPFFLWASLVAIIGSGIWALIELGRRFFVVKKTTL